MTISFQAAKQIISADSAESQRCVPAKPVLAGAPFAGIGSFVKRTFRSEDPGTVEMDVTRVPTEQFKVHEIVGDGRCMFRATARSLARQQKRPLTDQQEMLEASRLQQTCYAALCKKDSKRYPDARYQVLHGYGGLEKYCPQLHSPKFWGGEVEMMIIARMMRQPIHVYKPVEELDLDEDTLDSRRRKDTRGFRCIQKFGANYEKPKGQPAKQPVRLLYVGGNHYNLLL